MAARRRTKVKSAVPKWRKPPVDVPVQALREFMAKYGADVTVMVTWSREEGSYQFVTIGSDQFYADSAVNLRNLIADGLKLHPLSPTVEDLRGDHPNVALDSEQIDFLIWALGFISGKALNRDQKFKDYVQKHHDPIVERLGRSSSILKHKPS